MRFHMQLDNIEKRIREFPFFSWDESQMSCWSMEDPNIQHCLGWVNFNKDKIKNLQSWTKNIETDESAHVTGTLKCTKEGRKWLGKDKVLIGGK